MQQSHHSCPVTRPIDIPPRGCVVETLDAPEHRAPPRYHSRTPPTHLSLDAQWGAEKLRHSLPGRGPVQACGCPPPLSPDYAHPLPSCLVSLTASITSTAAILSTEISKEYVIFSKIYLTVPLTSGQSQIYWWMTPAAHGSRTSA